jgi:hypothetical protein
MPGKVGGGIMTVADLAKSLEGLNPKMYVVVIHENDG